MDKDDVPYFRRGLRTGGAMKHRTCGANGSQHAQKDATIHQFFPCPSERGDFDDPPDPDVEPSEVVELGLRLLGGL